jgi:hypothetical protein
MKANKEKKREDKDKKEEMREYGKNKEGKENMKTED